MVFNKVLSTMVLFMVYSLAWASTEWNDSYVGWVAERPDGVILAYKQPCPNDILGLVPKKQQTGFRYARFVSKDTSIAGCWKAKDNNIVVFVWEDGTLGWTFQRFFNLLRQT